MGPIQTIDEFIGLLLRRRLVIAAVTVALTVLVLIYVLSRPVVFEATSVIQVETPTIAENADAQASGASAQRLQTIQQRLTTRDALLAMIDRHALYADLPLTNDEKVHLLRMAVRFEPVASVASQAYGAPQQVSALIISARADTAAKSARVANDFAQGVLDASAESQTSQARETLTFFEDENKRLEADTKKTEAEIADFRNANADALPEVREARRTEIRGIEDDLRGIDQSLVSLQGDKARIGQGRTLRENDLQQIEAIDAQAALLQSQKTAQAARRDALIAALTQGPDVEQALATLDRRLEQLQAQAEVSTKRLAEAETAQKLEERQQSERFTLLERAVMPDYPVTGGRRKLAMAGAFASVIAGVIVAFLLDLMNPVLRTRTQFERTLGLRPVVVIPDLKLLRKPIRRPGMSAHPFAMKAMGLVSEAFGRVAAAVDGRPVAGMSRQAVMGAAAALILVMMVLALT